MTKSNLQDEFFATVSHRQQMQVTLYLITGVRLVGVIASFDNFSIALRHEGRSQLIYKHSISTIMPDQPMRLGRPQSIV